MQCNQQVAKKRRNKLAVQLLQQLQNRKLEFPFISEINESIEESLIQDENDKT